MIWYNSKEENGMMKRERGKERRVKQDPLNLKKRETINLTQIL